jgi:16S rRNA (cytosine967-C5)-methyltransferase
MNKRTSDRRTSQRPPRRAGAKPRPPAPVPRSADAAPKLTVALHTELVTALLDVFVGGYRLDKVIERRLRANREWLAATREQFVETMHTLVREWRLRWNRAGLPDADYLRRVNFTRAKQVLQAQPLPGTREQAWPEAVRASLPDWLYAVGRVEFGPRWNAIVKTLNEAAPLFLRVNTLRTEATTLAMALAAEGIPAQPVAGHPETLRATGRRDLFRTIPFREGWFEVQDVHSQRIAPFLQVEPGLRVIDACAGSGGKSLHLAALMQNKGRILALDNVDWKLAELRRRAARAGADNLEARHVGSPDETAAQRTLKRLGGWADRVLIDAPCSGLGVLRRNPDARWKLSEEELHRLRTLQTQLLHDYSSLTKGGGKLVYATCSILLSENEAQVRAFLATHPGWSLEEELRLDPQPGGGDGFYAARLRRP